MKKTVRSFVCFSVVAVLLMVAVCPMTVFAADGTKEGVVPVAANEWMSRIDDEAYLNSVNIPGTHDSGMFYSTAWTSDYAVTQNTDVAGQLEAGARIFDIRLRYGGDNKAVLCHGQGSALRYDAEVPPVDDDSDETLYTYDIVLGQIAEFLNKHDSETVILTVQHEYKADDEKTDYDANGNEQNTATAVKKAEDELAAALKVEGDPIIRYTKAERYGVSVTMGEARGRAIIFEYNENDSMGFGNLMPDSRNNYEFTFAEKWNVLLPYFDSAPDQNIREFKQKKDFRAAYTSCTGQKAYNRKGEVIHNNVGIIYTDLIVPTPAKEAKYMRNLLLDYYFEKGAYYGWVSMDFIDEALARKIFESNNFIGEPEVREKAPQTYIKDIKGFLDSDYDDALEQCLSQGYTVLVGKKSSGEIFRDVNPYGDPIIIGYKTTTDPKKAIRNIVGAYDDDEGPSGYTMVEVSGSIYDYFTRLSGWDSEDTYLFYSKTAGKSPITELELTDAVAGKEMVKLNGSSKNFNLQEGFAHFYGLAVKRDTSISPTGTFISGGNLIIILVGVVLIAAVIVIFLIREKKLKKKYMGSDTKPEVKGEA